MLRHILVRLTCFDGGIRPQQLEAGLRELLVERIRCEVDLGEPRHEFGGNPREVDGDGHVVEQADALEVEERGTWGDRELFGFVEACGRDLRTQDFG